MIAPYVEKDATAFFTYDEFLEASSADATDPNSLVYFAVSMAESIENQLAGGEPTFNTSSFVVAAAGGGGKRPGEDFGGMQDTEQTAGDTVDDQTQRVPEQMGDVYKRHVWDCPSSISFVGVWAEATAPLMRISCTNGIRC